MAALLEVSSAEAQTLTALLLGRPLLLTGCACSKSPL